FLGDLAVARSAQADGENHVHVPARDDIERRLVPVPAVSQKKISIAAGVGLCHANDGDNH
ncbi:MAG: hypothetical protein MUF13_14030, partial [Akkermansiaceae bacterium]|nr:hypothetical protein [Akkermansiaceae bacterium]